MKTIAVIASFSNSQSVWNATKVHIDLMVAAGYDPQIFIIKGKGENLIGSEYKSRINIFKNNRKLFADIKRKKIRQIWCPTLLDVLSARLNLIGYKCQFTFWVQGTEPDESFLRNSSKLRRYILRVLERMAFHFSDKIIYVSESMRDFYKKYNCRNKQVVIIPCLSEFENFIPLSAKIPESYVYIGGLSAWQCFDEILDIYKQIETEHSTFHIITYDTDRVKLEIEKRHFKSAANIKTYTLTDRELTPKILSQFEYGFLIRRESPVNFVASPIKFLEYISCNVDVLMTPSVPTFANIVDEQGIGTILHLNEKLSPKCIRPFSNKARKVFDSQFRRDTSVKKYSKLYQ